MKGSEPNITSFYGFSCAKNGKDALDTHHSPSPFLALCPVPHFLPLLSPLALLASYAHLSAFKGSEPILDVDSPPVIGSHAGYIPTPLL
eukprot:1196062-Prorocentrum_minimum.AAC.3